MIQIILKWTKSHAKILFLLHWICDDKRFEICKNVNMSSVKCKYSISFFSKVNESFEKIIENKYLRLVPTNESKEIIKNMKKCGVKSNI